MDTNYCFGAHDGHLSAVADRIAKRHGCVHVNYDDPTGTRRGWFAGPNRGFPFDDQLAAAVRADIDRHGGLEALRTKRKAVRS